MNQKQDLHHNRTLRNSKWLWWWWGWEEEETRRRMWSRTKGVKIRPDLKCASLSMVLESNKRIFVQTEPGFPMGTKSGRSASSCKSISDPIVWGYVSRCHNSTIQHEECNKVRACGGRPGLILLLLCCCWLKQHLKRWVQVSQCSFRSLPPLSLYPVRLFFGFINPEPAGFCLHLHILTGPQWTQLEARFGRINQGKLRFDWM